MGRVMIKNNEPPEMQTAVSFRIAYRKGSVSPVGKPESFLKKRNFTLISDSLPRV
jgi:hypothetical protein